ncbi:hypothetical protein I545_4756 [Mycobacterium kansasii 662]|uniref:Uncharacterized protein n=2 Tax=Mycobacterium kansasii TaxID=1768 RepID=A0A1V3WWS2_MYCKA|nr:hypothetical protein I545_4756 [Mycobacterium kansasii 662]OOK71357.1 hypothetical protein BZL29_5711 [Mycobacterium kansasii]OOK76139.1 hypothetical protein BZL30_4193 [Mycobacterium kansasii]
MVRFAAVVAPFFLIGIPDAGVPGSPPARLRGRSIATVLCQS